MFNLYSEIDRNTVGIYNTLHDSAVLLNKDIYKNFPNIVEKDIIKTLIEEKLIYKTSFDEKLYFRYFINKLKYSPNHASFTVLLTSNCNFKCNYCFEGLNNRKVSMSSELAEDTANYIWNSFELHNSLNKIIVSYYGGEPLLNREAMISICENLNSKSNSQQKVDYVLISNLSLLTDNDIKFLKKYRFLNIQVALDGPKRIHDNRRSTKTNIATYDTIIDNINKLVKNKLSVIIIINYDNENYKYIDKLIIDLKEKLPTKKISFFLNPIIKSLSNQKCEKLFMSNGQQTDLLIKIYKKFRKNEMNVEVFGLRDMLCMATTDVSGVIDPLGNIYKCGFLMPNTKYQTGTIYDDLYYKLNYQFLLDEPWADCLNESCAYLPICGGGCRGIAIIENKSMDTPLCEKKEYFDKIQKYIIKDYLKDLIIKAN